MVSGIATSLILLVLENFNLVPFLNDWPLPGNPNMNSFPIIFFNSILGCFIATLLTKPESDDVLMKFYHNVRPWGFWKPVREKVMKADPSFVANKNFRRDMSNIVVGATWQITLMATPVYLVLREFTSLGICLAILAVTTTILKFNWWNKLEESYGGKDTDLKIPTADNIIAIEQDSVSENTTVPAK